MFARVRFYENLWLRSRDKRFCERDRAREESLETAIGIQMISSPGLELRTEECVFHTEERR